MRVVQHVTANLRVEQDRHDVERGAGQRIGRGDGAEGIGKQQDDGAEEAWPDHRDHDHAPVLRLCRAERCRRLAPFLLDAVDGRNDDHHHQRNLEIGIGERQAPEGQDVEAARIDIDAEHGVEQHGHQAEPAERGKEGEGQRHAGKIRGDAGKGQCRRAYPVGQAAAHVAWRWPGQKRADREEATDRWNPVGGGIEAAPARRVFQREVACIVLAHQRERGRIRNITAKMKNGATPSQCIGSRRRRASAGGAARSAAAGSERVKSVMPASVLDSVRAVSRPPGRFSQTTGRWRRRRRPSSW